jgi:hypothetical protein
MSQNPFIMSAEQRHPRHEAAGRALNVTEPLGSELDTSTQEHARAETGGRQCWNEYCILQR